MAASELPHFYPLLQHYCEITAPLLSMSPSRENPFLSEVLPLTLTSDMVMYAILAMAGLHAGYRDRKFRCAAKLYYGKLISMLKRRIDCATSEDSPTYLTVLLLLCYSEFMDGNIDGAFFCHLRAARVLMLNLVARRSDLNVDAGLYGFLLEVYTYLAIVSYITPDPASCGRSVIFDTFLYDLDSLLGDQRRFGFLFGRSFPIFRLVPRILQLAACKSLAEETGDVQQLVSASIQFYSLESEIEQSLPHDFAARIEDEQAAEWQLQIASRVWQHAALVFLYTTCHGLDMECSDLDSHQKVEKCIQRFMVDHLELPRHSPIGTIFLWPWLILGSCMRSSHQQEYTVNALQQSKYRTRTQDSVVWLLQQIWSSGDHKPSSYGPLELQRMMVHHGQILSVA